MKTRKTSFYQKVRPKTEAVLTAFIAIGLIFFSTYLVHIKSIESLEKEIKIGLKSNVMSAATIIDGDLHEVFNAQTQRNDSLYLAETAPLEDIRQNSKDIRYLYTNIMVKDKVYFVLNPSPQNDNDGDGKPDLAPALMDEYNDPADALVKALQEKTPTVSEIYQDEWGTFVSAYAPFYNSKGEFVGTLGMDLELNNFFDRLEPIEIAFEKTVIIIIFIGLVIGLLIWYIRKHAQILLLHREESESKIAEKVLVTEHAYIENRMLLSRVQQYHQQANQHNDAMGAKFQCWLQHAIQYQESKIPFKKINPINFSLIDFIKGVEDNLSEHALDLELRNEVALSFEATGVPLNLYIDAFTNLMTSVTTLTGSTHLKMHFSLLDEGINELILGVKIYVHPDQDFEEKLKKELAPRQEMTTLEFSSHDFRMVTAVQLLNQYDCQVAHFSDDGSSGLFVTMKLSKPLEY